MKYAAYGFLALLVFAVSLVALMPADRAFGWMAANQQVRAQVGSVGGTLVSGVARDIRWARANLEQVHWRWLPARLMQGRLAYHLRLIETEPARATALDAEVSIGWQRQLAVSTITGELELPRALEIAGVSPPPVNGRLRLDLNNLRLDGRMPSALDGSIQLRGLHTAFGKTLQFGDFNVDLNHDGKGTINGKLRDLGGPLVVSGTLELRPGGRYQLAAKLRPGPQAEPEIGHILGLLGAPDASGYWQLQVDGILRR